MIRVVNALLKATTRVSLESPVAKVHGIPDKAGDANAWMPDEEKAEETEEQEIQLRAAIQEAYEDLRRQERIMGLVEPNNGDELESP